MVLAGTAPPPGTKSLAGYLYGIRSEIDGAEHMLPEALVELWHTNRISAEALPRLLLQMQPTLKAWDYRPFLRNKMITVLQYVMIALFTLLALLPVVVSVLTGEIPLEATLWMTPMFGAFGALAMYIIFFRKKARRKRQMKWALAQV